MNVTLDLIGLTFTADVDYEPYVAARVSGPPEDCYPAEGGTAEITALKCGDSDATFLLQSDLADELNDTAYEACEDEIKSRREEAEEDRATEAAYDREYAR